MQSKKILIGALVVALLAGGAFAYTNSDLLQGKFGGKNKLVPSTSTELGGKNKTESSSKADFSLGSDGVEYDESLNYFAVKVCGKNISSTAQTKLQFDVSGGQKNTVEFTPKEGCQTVNSSDLKTGLFLVKSGTYTVTATVDFGSLHSESDENNNSVSSSVTLSPNYYLYDANNLPDLTIEDIVFDYDSVTLQPSVCVDGTLNAFASDGDVTVTYAVLQGSTKLVDTDYALPSEVFDISDSCETINIDASAWGTGLTETLTTGIFIDVMDATPETDEDNNSYFEDISVTCSGNVCE